MVDITRRIFVRRGTLALVALGLLLGASLYMYQLSWFLPVFGGATLVLWPHLFRRERAVSVFGVVALGGALDTGVVATAQTAVGRDDDVAGVLDLWTILEQR